MKNERDNEMMVGEEENSDHIKCDHCCELQKCEYKFIDNTTEFVCICEWCYILYILENGYS